MNKSGPGMQVALGCCAAVLCCGGSPKPGGSRPWVGRPAGHGQSTPDNAVLSLCNISHVQSMKWCDEGIYLLASQPVDKCQSQDGAEAALQEIEKFLETGAENKIQELNKIYQDYESILTKDLMVRGAGVCRWWGVTPDEQKDPMRNSQCIVGAHRAQLPFQHVLSHRAVFLPPGPFPS